MFSLTHENKGLELEEALLRIGKEVSEKQGEGRERVDMMEA